MQRSFMHDPDWFTVVGGPPPADVLVRELFLAVAVLVVTLVCGLLMPPPWRFFHVLGAPAVAAATFLALRQTWRRSQQVRVLGSVLEHRDGARMVRVALTRAVLSTAADPTGLLILILDDGTSHVSVARRAEDHELSDLPPIAGPYLELEPEDFEAVRIAAQRTYAQA